MAETLTLFVNQPIVSAGLTASPDTFNYTVPTGGAGLYTVHVEFTEPPPSGVVATVKQNSTTVYTAATLGQTQSAQQFKYTQLYSDADVIHVLLSSSTATDLVANAVKAIVSVRQGL